MKSHKTGILYIILVLLTSALHAQDTTMHRLSKREERTRRINAIIKQEEEGIITHTKHTALGLKLISDGIGAFFEYGKVQTVDKMLLFQFEIAERKHPKEEKVQNEYSPTAPVIYGKVNYFYPVKLGVQEQLLLGNKGNKNGVSVSANAGGGISLGLLRPYLVEVEKSNGVYEFVGYNSPDSLLFLNPNYIVGGPNFNNGWNQLKLVPGLYLKASARFDYGRYNEMINALEIGLSGEYYFKKIQQMVDIKQYNYFIGAYVAMVFGRRK